MSDPTRVTVTKEPCSCGSIHASFARHRDFPETRGEGQTAKAAASRLAATLTISLDHAPTDRQRAQIRDAIEDVNAFAAQCGECGAAPCPPVGRPAPGLRGILVGLDGSPHSASAVRLGIAKRLEHARAELERVGASDYPTTLVGTIGADPIHRQPGGSRNGNAGAPADARRLSRHGEARGERTPVGGERAVSRPAKGAAD